MKQTTDLRTAVEILAGMVSVLAWHISQVSNDVDSKAALKAISAEMGALVLRLKP